MATSVYFTARESAAKNKLVRNNMSYGSDVAGRVSTAAITGAVGDCDGRVGPWDAYTLGLDRCSYGTHSLWRTVSTVSMDIPVPPGASVGVEKSEGEPVEVIHLSLPSSSIIAVTITGASTTDGALWPTVRTAVIEEIAATGAEQSIIQSPVGDVLRAVTPHGDVVIWGGDGPRWSMKAVLFGTSVSDDDMDAFYTVICDSVVFRGERPCASGTPLDLSVIEIR